MKRFVVALACAPLLVLGACGDTVGDRALSGGGIGAGLGLVGGLLAGSPLTGALIGGAVGAGAGALTTPGQVNFGQPAWR
jgi:osmotically inducible lipoprotein OsmB